MSEFTTEPYLQELFNYLSDELGAIALQGQMGDICDIVRRMDKTGPYAESIAIGPDNADTIRDIIADQADKLATWTARARYSESEVERIKKNCIDGERAADAHIERLEAEARQATADINELVAALRQSDATLNMIWVNPAMDREGFGELSEGWGEVQVAMLRNTNVLAKYEPAE